MDERKHVVVLTQLFPPERALLPWDIARALSQKGYKVSVVTGYPNRPGGKLYAGYRQRLRFSEVMDGIRVHRVPLVINHSRKALERITNFLSFSVAALSVSRKIQRADAVYVYATPATAAIPAQVWHKLFGIPYVLHVQDLWPESVTESGMIRNEPVNKFVHRVLTPWVNRLYRQSEVLIAISSGMKDLLVQRGSAARSCAVVYNWADEMTVVQKPSDSFSDTSLRLIYAGNLGPMQDLETLIDAASRHDGPDNFHLTIAGGGVFEEKIKMKAEELPHVEFVGRLSPVEVSKLYLQSDFQLVTLKDLPIFRTTVPSKLQVSLASGAPVITTVKGDVADLIQQYEAGLVAEPEDIESLSSAFYKARKMSAADRARMGRNARQLYEDLMSLEAGTSSIVSIMDKVVDGKLVNVEPEGKEPTIENN